MKMLRLVLFVLLGIIVWRVVRVALRTMQAPRNRGGEGPAASPTSPRQNPDLREIQDADFEDITDKTPPDNPPPKP